jgi:hypothetical protein
MDESHRLLCLRSDKNAEIRQLNRLLFANNKVASSARLVKR